MSLFSLYSSWISRDRRKVSPPFIQLWRQLFANMTFQYDFLSRRIFCVSEWSWFHSITPLTYAPPIKNGGECEISLWHLNVCIHVWKVTLLALAEVSGLAVFFLPSASYASYIHSISETFLLFCVWGVSYCLVSPKVEIFFLVSCFLCCLGLFLWEKNKGKICQFYFSVPKLKFS